MRSILLIKYSIVLSILSLLQGCTGENIPSGRILVKNDIQDKEYNVLHVSAGGQSFSLKPGERVLLPKGATHLNFSRRYKEFTRSYDVRCPENLKKGISIKLIDVHVGRIAGGCETVNADKG